MGFLRRILGREPEPAAPAATDEAATDEAASDGSGTTADEEERARERELLKTDAARLEDELLQRQLRYADRSWTPPRQGGERRSEDGDAGGQE